MATYRKPDPGDGADKILNGLLKGHDRFSDLKDAGLTVQLQFAMAPRNAVTGEPEGPALSKNGYPCAGKAEVHSQKLRSKGLPDCCILLDGDNWDSWPEAKRRAVIAHELYHFELQLEEADGEDGQAARVKTDDCFRPKVKARPHDWEIGGFNAMAEDFGEDAVEVQCLQAAVREVRRYVQLSFGWDEAAEPTAAGAA